MKTWEVSGGASQGLSFVPAEASSGQNAKSTSGGVFGSILNSRSQRMDAGSLSGTDAGVRSFTQNRQTAAKKVTGAKEPDKAVPAQAGGSNEVKPAKVVKRAGTPGKEKYVPLKSAQEKTSLKAAQEQENIQAAMGAAAVPVKSTADTSGKLGAETASDEIVSALAGIFGMTETEAADILEQAGISLQELVFQVNPDGTVKPVNSEALQKVVMEVHGVQDRSAFLINGILSTELGMLTDAVKEITAQMFGVSPEELPEAEEKLVLRFMQEWMEQEQENNVSVNQEIPVQEVQKEAAADAQGDVLETVIQNTAEPGMEAEAAGQGPVPVSAETAQQAEADTPRVIVEDYRQAQEAAGGGGVAQEDSEVTVSREAQLEKPVQQTGAGQAQPEETVQQNAGQSEAEVQPDGQMPAEQTKLDENLQADAEHVQPEGTAASGERVRSAGHEVVSDRPELQEKAENTEQAAAWNKAAGGQQDSGESSPDSGNTGNTQTQFPDAAEKLSDRTEADQPFAVFTDRLSQAFERMADNSVQEPAEMMGRIVEQVVRQVRIRILPETTHMELQLNPASLGRVLLQVTSVGRAATATLTVENQVAKEALESQMMQLKQSFEEQGLKVDSVEVSVAEYGLKQSQGQMQGQGDSQDSRRQFRENAGADQTEAADGEAADGVQTADARRDRNSVVDYTA